MVLLSWIEVTNWSFTLDEIISQEGLKAVAENVKNIDIFPETTWPDKELSITNDKRAADKLKASNICSELSTVFR